ncbi:CRISPR-associated helicase Cas3', partial [Acidithiobacillus caldus]|uniref:CRISPR-associated helicase Cas3' n=1 Tax=Acidithiobacillus caldus TaxID=33059 RepID=UPI001C065784
MTPPREIFYRYWGKAGTEADDGHHLLVYHCLDVAACGIMLLRWIPTWRKLLERLSGLSSEEIKTRLLVNLALHDLGKFATAFQNLRPDLLQRLQERQSDKCYSERHDTLGCLLWREKLQSQFLAAEPGRSRRRGSSNPGVDSWMQAVTGHHGEPPADVKTILRHHFDADDIEAARAFVSEILELAGVETFPMPPDGNAKAASWWLAGLAVLADWLGSNTLFFPYRDTAVPLSDYWSMALSQAERAVNATGLVAGQTSPHFGLKDCFAEPPPEFQPTPLQDWAQRAKIEPGPSLFILEDVTGAGKTEAALMLAWRLLHTNQGTGMYFGLPTMATANGMYQRLGGGEPPVYARLFGEQHLPSLVLAHGQADLVEGFRASILPFDTDEPDYGDGTVPAGPRCNAWLSDNRKKALLAEVGVGTIDQALLGVLPARHQSLRLLGLLGKVLIVDEVHACDAYMNRLLEELLRAHAHAGGSAILLSATLPYGQKKRLVQAFATGAGYDPINLLANDDYPLATCLVRGQIEQQAVNTRPDVARRMAVRFVEEESAVETLLQKTIAKDQCACWICNTVDDARSRFERLSADHPDWRIDLFHARFTLHDRLRIEQQVLRDFGKDSGPHERHRRILIATQVVEQSLDLDFDELISDLAPVDLILQRAGRLRRHKRDRIGQRVDGPDQRGTPTLTVLAPPWTDDPDPHWLRNALPGTAAVYRDEDARLWLAMKRLHESGG